MGSTWNKQWYAALVNCGRLNKKLFFPFCFFNHASTFASMLGNPLILCAYYFPAVDDNLFCEFHHSNSAGGFIYAYAGEGRGGEGRGGERGGEGRRGEGEGEEEGWEGKGRVGREGKGREGKGRDRIWLRNVRPFTSIKHQASLVKSGICIFEQAGFSGICDGNL